MSQIPPGTVNAFDYERLFHERHPDFIRAYIAGFAGDGLTARQNRHAFDAIRLRPRVLQSMVGANTGLELFGQSLNSPIMIAPMAWHGLVHKDGELETAHGAGLTGHLMCLSTQSSHSIEDVAAIGRAPKWFQLYVQPHQDVTLDLMRRAEAAGYGAIVVCVDAPITGIRNIEQKAGFALPNGVSSVNIAGYYQQSAQVGEAGSPIFQGMLDHAPTWETMRVLRAATKLPLLLKGVMTAQDAQLAQAHGFDGVIVSNHGGRCLDCLPASIEVLPEIVAAVGEMPVLLDGGIRRGTDVAKALALGAKAVMVGQPCLHALGVGGHVGLAHLLTILQTEFEAAMALMGVRQLSDFGPEAIWNAKNA